MKKGIFLDRDGTIIIDKIYLNDVKEITYLPNVVEALRLLRDSGFAFFIATNQSGIARGLVDIRNLYLIHEKIRSDMAAHGIDFVGFYYAPYSVESNHFLRKPNPGMLLTAARDHGVDLKKSWMIGDRMSDVEAGNNAGTRSILLANQPVEHADQAAAVVPSLLEAANFILKNA
jgi:D-glycero-D-manno-heptose 1,7-bisphosphate phosphatase